MKNVPTPEDRAPRCPRAAEATAFVLGEGTGAARADFERHAAACPACAAVAAAHRRVAERLRSDPEAACAPGLADRVMRAVEADAGRAAVRRRAPIAFRPLLARAAAVAAVAGAAAWGLRAMRRAPAEAGSPSAPAARRASIEWLCRAQRADGGWDAADRRFEVGVSAAALMALLNEERPAADAELASAVRRGAAYLQGRQDERGLFGPDFFGGTYNQGLATLALLEAAEALGEASWQAAAARGARHLASIQDDTGGWSYLQAAKGDVNTSASVWPLLALLRAEARGVSGLREGIDRGLAWMRSTINADGFMGYQRANESPYGYDTLTAAGAVCLLRGGRREDDPILRAMLGALRRPGAASEAASDVYRSFFVFQALALSGTDAADAARTALGDRLASWPRASGGDAGRWPDADRWGTIGGSVYATAFASMSRPSRP